MPTAHSLRLQPGATFEPGDAAAGVVVAGDIQHRAPRVGDHDDVAGSGERVTQTGDDRIRGAQQLLVRRQEIIEAVADRCPLHVRIDVRFAAAIPRRGDAPAGLQRRSPAQMVGVANMLEPVGRQVDLRTPSEAG